MTNCDFGTVPSSGTVAKGVGQLPPTESGDSDPFDFCVADNLMFFDLETIPDESRRERIESGMDTLPEPPGEPKPYLDCEKIDVLLGLSIPLIEKRLLEMLPEKDYLIEVASEEKARAKPRTGVLKAIEECHKKLSGENYYEAISARNKLLSITPEYCSICAFSYAIGIGEIECVTAYDLDSEYELLEKFWSLASLDFRLIGFNILAFDLPVIFARSMILGVSQRRTINTAPFRNPDVLDLYVERFGSSNKGAKGTGTLKSLAAAYGIHTPAGDVDGSQVYELYKSEKPNFKKLIEYSKSDVQITRELYCKGRGFFWE